MHLEAFADQAVRLRWRTGLTQREVAGLLELSEGTVQRWETGRGLPATTNMHALLALYLERGAFVPGYEEAGAAAFWEALRSESQRLLTPFDRTWFRTLRPATHPVGLPSPHQDWGDAPDVTTFYGRAEELTMLAGWVHEERAHLITVLGIGGVGKTMLVARLAHDLAPTFDCLYWRSLRNAPPVEEWLAGVISLLSEQRAALPSSTDAQFALLRDLLRDRHALLVLDNLDTVLEPGVPLPRYRRGYEGYGEVLQRLGERDHQATLLVTSREPPPEIAPSSGPRFTWKVLRLAGLGQTESRALLQQQRLAGNEAAWEALVARYSGNPLALRLVGQTISAQYAGRIAAFLAARGAVPANVGWLLEGQVSRLSSLERAVLRRLAVCREPVSFAELARSLVAEGRGAVLGAVEGLRGRSLLERGGHGATITLQPVVLEYVTDQLVQAVGTEVVQGQPTLLLSQELVQATAPDYVRRSQERLIATPLLEALSGALGGLQAVERRLLDLLDAWRGREWEAQGYGPGNVVNLLRLLRGNLQGLDLSRLAIRQAYLAGIEAQDVSLAGAHLSEVVLAEAFTYPIAVALSDDGASLVAGTASGEVWLWRVAGRTLLVLVQGHTSLIYGVALSGDGRLLASGSIDGTARLWEVPSGQPLATLQGRGSGIYGVALSKDGRLMAGGCLDGAIRLWEASSGRLLATLEGHTAMVWSVALSGDGRLLASGSEDRTVKLWEVETGRLLATLQGHTGRVRGVALSRDGQLVVSGSLDGTVRLWDAPRSGPGESSVAVGAAALPAGNGRSGGEQGRLLAILEGHRGGVLGVALSTDGRLVASCSEDGKIRLWEVPSGQPLAILEGHTGGIWGVALSGDGRLLASGSLDGSARLWETASGRPLATLQGHAGLVAGVALSGYGPLLASGSFDGMVRLWDAESGRLLATRQWHAGRIYRVALSADGRIGMDGSEDGTARLWEVATAEPLAILRGHTGAVWAVAISADVRRAASGSEDGTARLWDVPSGRLLATLGGHTGGVRDVVLSTDGQLLVSASLDGTIRLWEAPSGLPLFTLEGHTAGVLRLALSTDGRLLASGSYDGTVRLWEVPGGRPLAILEGHTGSIWGVALSTDGRLLASGSVDGTIRLWEVPSGRHLTTIRGHTGGILGMALSGDGQLLASGGYDGTIGLWEVPSGTSLRTLRADRRYERLDITGLTGVTEAQRTALLALGAVERSI
jgi:WD40 repeat protein/transcriptional regulator with XRE-family HTH domain